MEIKRNITDVNRTVKQSREIKYIVVHYTENKGDTAYNNTKYFKTVRRGASAHYFVDENEVWQCVEDKDVAWHCGTNGKYYHADCRNANSIGVEMCNSMSKNEVVERNTAELVRYLIKKYKLNSDRILRHYDVTHKQCPLTMINEGEWQKFKDSLKEDEPMTEAEKAKMQAIDDSLTNLYEIVNRMVEEMKKKDVVYNTIDEVPEWGRPAVQRLIDEGKLNGTGDTLALDMTLLRAIVLFGDKE